MEQDFVQCDLPCPLLEQRFSELKKSIINPADKQRVIELYGRLVQLLSVSANRIAKHGPAIIPEIPFADIAANNGKLPEDFASRARETGCLIIRGVVSEKQATAWEKELKDYTRRHPEVAGFPKHDPQNFSLFWTKPQVEIRSHESVLKAMHAVGQLWHLSDEEAIFDLSSQVAYAHRFRIRHPSNNEEYTLPAHQDSGAIERWEDPMYRTCYQKVFQGRWEAYDAWNADFRSNAKTDLYATGESCSVFRSLPGWLSLSHTGTGEGTLRLVPNLKLATAYLLLRPYFILEEQFDNTTRLFPGARPGSLQFFPTESLHPHLDLKRTMIGIPPVTPGDYVFWHCDLIHKVDKLHPGTRDSSVSYNACVPLCLYKVESLVGLRKPFLDVLPPKDFAKYNHGELEAAHDDHGAHAENILSLEGRRAMGFEKSDFNEEGITMGQRRAKQYDNEMLGFN